MAVYFISGIDTDAGKSIVTGVIARTLLQKGVHVITQKFIQTGCVGISEDILKHREIMGYDLSLCHDLPGFASFGSLTRPGRNRCRADSSVYGKIRCRLRCRIARGGRWVVCACQPAVSDDRLYPGI